MATIVASPLPKASRSALLAASIDGRTCADQ